MASNAQLRSLYFATGVEITPPSGLIDDADTVSLANNQTAQALIATTFDLALYKEIIFDYSIRRRTDTPVEYIERGRFRLTAMPDQAGAAKWVLAWDFKSNEGTGPGITISKSVAGNIVSLLYDSTNLAGANHACTFAYKITPLLV